MDIKFTSNKESDSADYSKGINFNTLHGKIVYTWLVFMLGMICGSLYLAFFHVPTNCSGHKDVKNITVKYTATMILEIYGRRIFQYHSHGLYHFKAIFKWNFYKATW